MQTLLDTGINLDDSELAIQITLRRPGERPRKFDPDKDIKLLMSELVREHDTIHIVDIRKHPVKAQQRKLRISKMLRLGSSEIGVEVRQLAKLRHEYADWKGKLNKKEIAPFIDFLNAEVESLKISGHASKTLGLVELHRGELLLMGLGRTHPKILNDDELITILRASINENG